MIEYYTAPEVLRVLNISEQAFQTCLKAALYRTGHRTRPRRFSFQDLIILRTAKGLCDAGISVTRIRRVLKSLKEQLSPDQRLANLKVYADGKRVVVVDGSRRWRPESGQFLLDFDAQELQRSKVHLLPEKQALKTTLGVEELFEKALRLEEDSPEEAREAYQRVLQLEPDMVEAHINLGFLHHNAGEFDEAEKHYRDAIRYGPDEALAYFNLAVLSEDQGNRTEAIRTYQQVLDRWPDYQDAHQNIARLYEAEGQCTDAIRHYAAARKLVKKKDTDRY